jgi:uncharacterized protein YcbX
MNIAANPGGMATADIPACSCPSTNGSQAPGTDVTVWQDTVTIGTADAYFNSLLSRRLELSTTAMLTTSIFMLTA